MSLCPCDRIELRDEQTLNLYTSKFALAHEPKINSKQYMAIQTFYSQNMAFLISNIQSVAVFITRNIFIFTQFFLEQKNNKKFQKILDDNPG